MRLLELDLEPRARGSGALRRGSRLGHQAAFFCSALRGDPGLRAGRQAVGAGGEDLHVDHVADRGAVSRCTDCSQGDLPIIWPGFLPLRSSSTWCGGRRSPVEGELLLVDQRLQPLQPLVHHLGRDLLVHVAAGVPGRGNI
jgi:hypothetical protein